MGKRRGGGGIGRGQVGKKKAESKWVENTERPGNAHWCSLFAQRRLDPVMAYRGPAGPSIK